VGGLEHRRVLARDGTRLSRHQHEARELRDGEIACRGVRRGGAESEPLRGVQQRFQGVRRRKLAQHEVAVERQAVQLAHGRQRPHNVLAFECDLAHA
jgi:hypothetical protein